MGTILASAIVDKAERLLNDPANDRWSEAELLGWLNDGQRQIALMRPDASVTNGNITLVAGTKQSIPSSGLRLLDVTRNMGVGGSTPGSAVTLIDRDKLDSARPGWHTDQSGVIVRHYMVDERNPKNFYVYPPANASSPTVEAIYSISPADVTINNPITLDDIFEGPLLDFILFRAYSADSEFSDAQQATMHYGAFTAALGIKTKMDIGNSPRRNAPPVSSLEGLR